MKIGNISLSEKKLKELSDLPEKELRQWLDNQHFYKGIATSIRDKKLKDVIHTIKRSQKQAPKIDPTTPARRGRKNNND